MYRFGKQSQAKLDTCIPELQEILNEAIKEIDFTVLCGHRGKAEQDEYFHTGRSKLSFPASMHNANPSNAVDIAPYPIDWNNVARFAHLIGLVRGIARMKGYKIRVGCDWDMDGDITNHSFMDYPHIEFIGWELKD